MADKLRSVNTKFWNDTFIEELNVHEKLLFIYLLTNPQTNILGIYEISLNRISYETGINKETILKAFESFGRLKKAFYIDNFIILPNFLKNQKLNSNMKIGAAKIFNELPMSLKNNILGNGIETISNDSEGFEMVRNGLVKYEIEIESKKEEIENEKEKPKDFNFKNSLINLGIEKQIISDWLKVRSNKKAVNSETAFNKIKSEIIKSHLSPNECIKIAVENSWSGFNAEWVMNKINKSNVQNPSQRANFSIRQQLEKLENLK